MGQFATRQYPGMVKFCYNGKKSGRAMVPARLDLAEQAGLAA